MRCVAEFRNAGRFRDQEFHIEIVDHVSDLLGAEQGTVGTNTALAHSTPKIEMT